MLPHESPTIPLILCVFLYVQGESSAVNLQDSQVTLLRLETDLREALLPPQEKLFLAMKSQIGGLKFLVNLRGDLRRAIRLDLLPFFF